VSTDKVFKSKVLDTDETFSFTFSTPGTFPYFCSIHPNGGIPLTQVHTISCGAVVGAVEPARV
jgi:hypothetical protein